MRVSVRPYQRNVEPCITKGATFREACTDRTDNRFPLEYSSTLHDLDPPGRADRYVPDLYDLYELYDLAHVAGWELCNVHDLTQHSWVEPVLYRSCTTSHHGRLGLLIDDLDHDL